MYLPPENAQGTRHPTKQTPTVTAKFDIVQTRTVCSVAQGSCEDRRYPKTRNSHPLFGGELPPYLAVRKPRDAAVVPVERIPVPVAELYHKADEVS